MFLYPNQNIGFTIAFLYVKHNTSLNKHLSLLTHVTFLICHVAMASTWLNTKRTRKVDVTKNNVNICMYDWAYLQVIVHLLNYPPYLNDD